MIKLLYFTSEPHPTFRADMAALFGKHLPRFGVYSDLVTTKTKEYAGESWPPGQAILATNPVDGFKMHVVKFWHFVTTAVKAERSDYAAFQVRDMPFQAFFLLLIARMRRVPFIYWCSYPFPEAQIIRARETRQQSSFLAYLVLLWRGRIGRWLAYRVIMAKADHVFVQSEQMRTDFRRHGIASVKMTPVPMGVDLEALSELQSQPLPNFDQVDHRVLVYLGTMERERRIEVLFNSLAALRKTIPNVKLVLVGGTRDPVHEKWLHQQALNAGVTDLLHWTGWIPMAEAWSYVRCAELGFSPFPRGFILDSASPTKVPEYLAMGVPVICNENPDQQWMVEQSQGGICVTYDADSFAQAAVMLLQESPEQRQQRIDKGKAFVAAERDYSVIAKRLAEIYQGICEGIRIDQTNR